MKNIKVKDVIETIEIIVGIGAVEFVIATFNKVNKMQKKVDEIYEKVRYR